MDHADGPAPADTPPNVEAAPHAGEDIVALLTRQHREVEDLLKGLLEAEEADDRASRLARAGDHLAVHISAEEQVFYPAVRAGRTEDILMESLEEHLSLKRLLADLLVLDTGEDTFKPKSKVLEEQTRHHHKEEEEHLFPSVRLLLDETQRLQLARDVARHEKDLYARGAPRTLVKSETDAAQPLE
jgi:hemerythrin superfamily protein